jgi:hypothetical protein
MLQNIFLGFSRFYLTVESISELFLLFDTMIQQDKDLSLPN